MKKWKILREIFNYLQFSVFISLSFQNGQKNSSLFFWLITEITRLSSLWLEGEPDQVVMQRLMECDCLFTICRKNVCSHWVVQFSIPWLFKQIYKKRCNLSSLLELENRFPRNTFIRGHFNVTAFPDFALCNQCFITWVIRSLVTT